MKVKEPKYLCDGKYHKIINFNNSRMFSGIGLELSPLIETQHSYVPVRKDDTGFSRLLNFLKGLFLSFFQLAKIIGSIVLFLEIKVNEVFYVQTTSFSSYSCI
ncbi:putative membrane protein [Methanobacterium sp. MB1]|nr:putative membrane protein [Methanobacterium sp. MB1]